MRGGSAVSCDEADLSVMDCLGGQPCSLRKKTDYHQIILHMTDITAIVLTYNEEKHIQRCIDSLRGVATRICVVDSFSTDKTVEIATAAGAEVFQNQWINYSSQFSWAINNCRIRTAWTMRIDADEYLDATLKASVTNFVGNPNEHNAAVFCRKIVFLRREIKHGFFYPALMLRLWKTGQGAIESRWMDEHITVSDAVLCRLEGDLVDENLNDLSWWATKHISYAQREVYDLVEARQREDLGKVALTGQAKIKRLLKTRLYSRLPTTVRGSLYFFYRYVIGLGFLDGKAGFFFHFLQAFWYRVFVDAKLYELELQALAENSTPYRILQRRGIFPQDA